MATNEHEQAVFSETERAAMKQRAAELREQEKGGKGSAKKQRGAGMRRCNRRTQRFRPRRR
ncbi:hypothetical protein GCM10027057_12720 [Marisediminicola antarctica]